MLKLLLTGVWVCAVTLGAVYFSVQLATAPAPGEAGAKKANLQLVKGESITIPVINDGGVNGYFLSRISLRVDKTKMAKIELPARTWELAAEKGADVKQVTVRNQRSRWGSCSAGGTVSLNWRLVQAPESVRDYIICHELAHLRQMNHSDRFWAQVEAYFPAWREAEHWLKRHGSLLGL